MKNIHLIPTDKSSRLYKNLLTDKLFILENSFMDVSECNREYQNIYITSKEVIRVGDWVLNIEENTILKPSNDEIYDIENSEAKYYEFIKKIILTTDQDLINDGVQAIDDDFLEWFVKNPSCEYVEVYNDKNVGYEYDHYSIIIPKKQQKQHLIDMMKKDEELGLYDIENDWDKILEEYYDQPKLNFISLNKWLKENYEIPKKKMGTKQEIKLEDIFNDEKRLGVKELIDKHKQDDENYLDSFGVTKTQFEMYRNFNKQETLEGLADKWVFETNGHKWSNNNNEAGDNFGSFIAGFKEAEKTLYSEEDLFKILLDFVAFPHEYMEPRGSLIERYLKELKKK